MESPEATPTECDQIQPKIEEPMLRESSESVEEDEQPGNVDEDLSDEQPGNVDEDLSERQAENVDEDLSDKQLENTDEDLRTSMGEWHPSIKSEGMQPPSANEVWTLPDDKDVCTLEEIRRGQVINKVAPNECPVIGCGKKINELRAEPSPGTIASGLRTHVLFVHYASLFRKAAKKRKNLTWTAKRRGQPSPRKQFLNNDLETIRSPPTHSDIDLDIDEPENCAISNFSSSGLNLTQKNRSNLNGTPPGSLLSKKIKQLSANKPNPPSSLQSLIQATGGNLNSSGPRSDKNNGKQKQIQQDANLSQKGFNQTTSSLFSILAGLTQQQSQTNHQQQAPSVTRPIKNAHSQSYTVNMSQCSRNKSPNTIPSNNLNNYNNNNSNNNNAGLNNSNPPVNSSLLTLLNEKISGNVASSLQTQLKKNLLDSSQLRVPTTSTQSSRQNLSSPANQSYYSNNPYQIDSSYNTGTSILNSLCTGNGESRVMNFDSSLPLNSFIELIAIRTGSNIGQAGVAEAKKIIEKFTTSLICSSQTIADHYLAPYGDVPQQKPEISPSDVILAYKMMQRTSSP